MKKSGRPRKQRMRVDTVQDLLIALQTNSECELAGLGTFSIRECKSRQFKDRWSENIITSKAYNKIGFIAFDDVAQQFQVWNN